MAARTINLSDRHNKMLDKLKTKLDISLSEVVSRALEMLEVAEAKRDQETKESK